jgi:hypothetical protein
MGEFIFFIQHGNFDDQQLRRNLFPYIRQPRPGV